MTIARVVGRTRTAPAPGLDLERHPFVGDLEQALGALEQLTAEVGDEAERVHVDLEIVDDASELVALLRRVELRLVAHHVVDRPVGDGERVQVEIGLDVDRRRGHAQPAGDLVAVAVEARQQQAVQLARGEVVVDLQRERALARAHRAEAEAQRRHVGRGRYRPPPALESSPTCLLQMPAPRPI